ncbi:biotin transporter BioY [Pararhodobacter zhoushanensis]|uniref:biotin transporter BioY n=1 Tax=Pararhodobacter zhoushanensis TaxID=2479545 RepID=UPI000F8DC277|nr:biotin transporter BioY [Pararhodobacter zhoushanensis]
MTSKSATLFLTMVPPTASKEARFWRDALIVVSGTVLLALSARVQVPMWPVPMSMQSLAVLMLAMTLGARLSVATVAAYVVQGAVGMPVFASGAGLAYLVGPTGGYIIGFVALAAVTGWLSDRGWTRSFLPALTAALVGSAVLYACGATWLAASIGFDRAVELGVLPFLPGDLVKAALSALAVSAAWAARRRQQ